MGKGETAVGHDPCASLAHASRAIGDWIQFYSQRRQHRALGIRGPAVAFELAA